MASNKRIPAGITSAILMSVYSAIMMATSGTAASWAWLLLLAAAGLLVVAARSGRADAAGDRSDG